MVANGHGVVLLVLLLTLCMAPQRSVTPPPRTTVVSAAGAALVTASAKQPDPVGEPVGGTETPPADHTTALVAQFTAGVRGSRAPPMQSA